MKVACVQFKPLLEEKLKNIFMIKSYLANINADLIVFPELATTGYFFEDRSTLMKLADKFDSEVMSEFQGIASAKNATVIIGFAEKFEDKLYNSAACLMPNKNLSFVYRKTHLFYKERFFFDEGDTGFLVAKDRVRDLNIGVMICYDWRFPESARTLALKGADIIAMPSNLVTDRWGLVMPARALENKIFLAVCNRIGSECRGNENLTFNGASAIYNYNGSILNQSPSDAESVIICEFDPVRTRDKSFNSINNIFDDRRPRHYML